MYKCFQRLKKKGTPVDSLPPGMAIDPPVTRLITHDNVEQVFQDISRDLRANTLKWIRVYKCPLSAPFSSSTTTVRGYVQGQFLPFDYHAFVVIHTSKGKFCTVEKQTEGIYVSWSNRLESVLSFFDSESRPLPLNRLIHDKSHSSLYELMHCLKHAVRRNRYDIDRQCQHFARQIFDKFALIQFWDVSLPTDLTSPLMLLSDKGSPLFLLIMLASIIHELGLLFSDNSENATSYQFVALAVLLGLLLIGVLICTGLMRMDRRSWKHIMDLSTCALILECIVSAPFGAHRKRGELYSEKLKLESSFYGFWLTLSFGMIYVKVTWLCLLIRAVQNLKVLLEYLSEHLPVLSPVLNIMTWLLDYIRNRTGTPLYITWGVIAWFYLKIKFYLEV